jgi:hypothetical protein
MSMILMYITNNIEQVKAAQLSGIDRIFIDLEKKGKIERQSSFGSYHISDHCMSDVHKVKKVLDKSQLLVRINPISSTSEAEIEDAISCGAEIIMLPMAKSADEIEKFISLVDSRAITNILLETKEACMGIDDILRLQGIDEIHIGLNDLHLSFGMKFLFEPLSNGCLDELSKKITGRGIRFGFGGMGRIGTGLLPAHLILTEHYRLRSEMVILSISFRYGDPVSSEISSFDLAAEVRKIRDYEKVLNKFSQSDLEENRANVKKRVEEISGNIKCKNRSNE